MSRPPQVRASGPPQRPPKLSQPPARITTVTRAAHPARLDPAKRAGLADLVAGIAPWDDRERDHLASAAAWIASGAPLYRTGKPDIPATYLVSYFVVLDEGRGQMLLVDHRKARLWLPPGGHVEEGEDPWLAVVREALVFSSRRRHTRFDCDWSSDVCSSD